MANPDDFKLARACDICRRRKVKCTGQQNGSAKCLNCIRHNLNCTYEEGIRRRGPTKEYVEELEQRIVYLEAQLRQQSDASSGKSSPNSSRSVIVQPQQIVTDEDVLQAFRQLSIVGNHHGKSSNMGIFASLDMLRAKRTGKPSQGAPPQAFWTSYVARVFEADVQYRLEDHPLPESDLVERLVELYFSKYNAVLPVLHRPSFERHLQSGLARTSTCFRSLVFAVIAEGAQHSDDPRTLQVYPWIRHPAADPPDSTSRGFSFAVASRRLLFTLAGTSLFTIQAAALLCRYALASSGPLLGYAMAGCAGRIMIASGAHCAHNAGWNASLLQDELRKRAFWLYYLSDRILSFHLGRPYGMPDNVIDVELPLDISDDALDYWDQMQLPFPRILPGAEMARSGGLGSLRHQARMARLYEKISDLLYTPQANSADAADIEALNNALETLRQQVPRELIGEAGTTDRPLMCGSIMLHSLYYTLKMTILRANIASLHTPALETHIAQGRQIVLELSYILDLARRSGLLLETWLPAKLSARVAGVFFILTCYTGQKTLHLTSEFEAALIRLRLYLEALAPMISGGDVMASMLQLHHERLKEDLEPLRSV